MSRWQQSSVLLVLAAWLASCNGSTQETAAERAPRAETEASAGTTAQDTEPTHDPAVLEPADGAPSPDDLPMTEADAGAEPAGADASRADGQRADACPDGFARGPDSLELSMIASFTPSPEGVTVCPDGEVFVSADDGSIYRVPLDGGEPEAWSSLGDRQPAGITCDDRGHLFVAIFSDRTGRGSSISRIDARDATPIDLPSPAASGLPASLNGILAVSDLGVYASDSSNGWLTRSHETEQGSYLTEIVARDIPLANGLAYDPASHTLYVASSLGQEVLAFAVAEDGLLADRSAIASQTRVFFDGVAVDEEGTVYAADYFGGLVLELEGSRTVAEVTHPASLAFRGGRLLVTDYHLNEPTREGGLYALQLGSCGASTFAR